MVVSKAARKSARHRAPTTKIVSDLVRPASGSPASGAPGDGLLPAGVVSAPSEVASAAVGSWECPFAAWAPSRSTSRVLSELVLRSGVGGEAAIVAQESPKG